MKKNVFYLMLVLLTLFSSVSVMEMGAQVTIGKDTVPHPGAVLELRSSKGLLLPKVNLSDAGDFKLSSEKKEEAVGMLVYNLSSTTANGMKGEGLYVWNGSSWTLVAKSEKYVPVTGIQVGTQGDVKTVAPGGTLQFSAKITPANATNTGLIWTVDPSNAGSFDAPTKVFTAGNTAAKVTISAKAAGETSVVSNKIEIQIGSSNPDIVTGSNGTYAIHTFGSMGTWMVDGSKEGSPSYSEKVTGGGAYYSYTEAQTACPSGYAVPTDTQLVNLLTYLKNSATADEKTAWNALLSVGYYNNTTHNANSFCYLWTNKTNTYYYYDTPALTYINPETSTSIKVPVRCIKQ